MEKFLPSTNFENKFLNSCGQSNVGTKRELGGDPPNEMQVTTPPLSQKKWLTISQNAYKCVPSRRIYLYSMEKIFRLLKIFKMQNLIQKRQPVPNKNHQALS